MALSTNEYGHLAFDVPGPKARQTGLQEIECMTGNGYTITAEARGCLLGEDYSVHSLAGDKFFPLRLVSEREFVSATTLQGIADSACARHGYDLILAATIVQLCLQTSPTELASTGYTSIIGMPFSPLFDGERKPFTLCIVRGCILDAMPYDASAVFERKNGAHCALAFVDKRQYVSL